MTKDQFEEAFENLRSAVNATPADVDALKAKAVALAAPTLPEGMLTPDELRAIGGAIVGKQPNLAIKASRLADELEGSPPPAPARCKRNLGSRPDWMSPDQYDPCRCRLIDGHPGDHWCEHLDDVPHPGVGLLWEASPPPAPTAPEGHELVALLKLDVSHYARDTTAKEGSVRWRLAEACRATRDARPLSDPPTDKQRIEQALRDGVPSLDVGDHCYGLLADAVLEIVEVLKDPS